MLPLAMLLQGSQNSCSLRLGSGWIALLLEMAAAICTFCHLSVVLKSSWDLTTPAAQLQLSSDPSDDPAIPSWASPMLQRALPLRLVAPLAGRCLNETSALPAAIGFQALGRRSATTTTASPNPKPVAAREIPLYTGRPRLVRLRGASVSNERTVINHSMHSSRIISLVPHGCHRGPTVVHVSTALTGCDWNRLGR
jgi:hypothetical protein